MLDSSVSAGSAQSPKPPPVLYAMILFPVVVCAVLYTYYYVAQDVLNPMPVSGKLTSAECLGGGISKQGVSTGINQLRTTYTFPSRSKDSAQVRAATPLQDEIVDYVEYDKIEDCEAAELALTPGSIRTVWAGENRMSDRFRARLTAERAYPPLALLWIPACIALLILWGWRRVTRKLARLDNNLDKNASQWEQSRKRMLAPDKSLE